MPPVRFGVYTVLGCIPWTAALAVAGYLVGRSGVDVAGALHGPSLVLGALLVLLVIVGIVMLWRHRRRESGEHAAHGGRSEHRGHGENGENGEDGTRPPRARQMNRWQAGLSRTWRPVCGTPCSSSRFR
jgi:type VI protein secretion system component VasK